jgi:hypothetical protein
MKSTFDLALERGTTPQKAFNTEVTGKTEELSQIEAQLRVIFSSVTPVSSVLKCFLRVGR